MQIYLIRHTTPDIEKGICYGQTDLAVNQALFNEELKIIQAKIPDNIGNFFSSPLKRCKQLTGFLSTDYTTDNRLIELDFGDWEDKSWNELNQNELTVWTQDFVNNRPPNGENYVELHHRTTNFIESLLNNDYESAGIVTHAGNIRSFISWTLNLPLENSFRIDLAYGAVISLKIEKDRCYNKLTSINNSTKIC